MRLLLLLLLGLSTVNVYSQHLTSPEMQKRLQPRKPISYKLMAVPFELPDTSILSTRAVYVKVYQGATSNMLSSKPPKYIFHRYFPDGWVYSSFLYGSYPTDDDFNDLSYGRFGRYMVDKDGVIVHEMYIDKQDGIRFTFAKSSPTGIQFYAYSRHLHEIIKNFDTVGGYFQKVYPKLKEIPY